MYYLIEKHSYFWHLEATIVLEIKLKKFTSKRQLIIQISYKEIKRNAFINIKKRRNI